ncbi:PREDICTED: cytochrome b5-like [Nelumbo nucifera]|uniref:Cytochrome b5-like n=2 Tax=Nelumbo nucifera TaxID=4432 RepID=A0A1U8BLJ4_NELNU|nr:PREDICTED: cytochrome b5-like [Nelumbo nucifera]DAD25104.1 TPA_asm: hypothetical protein HUJ06_026568 [Nelumbo nucifera]
MEEYKAYSLSEVFLHSSKKDCWLIINDKVYDVTKFLEDHPGGEDVLLEASANGDATEAFDDVGHSSTATSMMNSYLIGFLEGSDAGKDIGGLQTMREKKEKGSALAKAKKEMKPSVVINLMQYSIPLIIFGVAFGAWYFLNKAN